MTLTSLGEGKDPLELLCEELDEDATDCYRSAASLPGRAAREIRRLSARVHELENQLFSVNPPCRCGKVSLAGGWVSVETRNGDEVTHHYSDCCAKLISIDELFDPRIPCDLGGHLYEGDFCTKCGNKLPENPPENFDEFVKEDDLLSRCRGGILKNE